jgi:branched-chain amino acid transport system ATP-binding protein
VYTRAIDAIQACALAELANRRAESLGLLDRKRLELARALATEPAILLLDEIGAGLTDAEADDLLATIVELRSRGIAIVWIEHIVHVLVRAVERLVCMDQGAIIAAGAPEDVMRDARVVDAYLGRAVA